MFGQQSCEEILFSSPYTSLIKRLKIMSLLSAFFSTALMLAYFVKPEKKSNESSKFASKKKLQKLPVAFMGIGASLLTTAAFQVLFGRFVTKITASSIEALTLGMKNRTENTRISIERFSFLGKKYKVSFRTTEILNSVSIFSTWWHPPTNSFFMVETNAAALSQNNAEFSQLIAHINENTFLFRKKLFQNKSHATF